MKVDHQWKYSDRLPTLYMSIKINILRQVKISNFNFVITTIIYFNAPTNNHHLIGWEDCNKTEPSSSWHNADEIPGVIVVGLYL